MRRLEDEGRWKSIVFLSQKKITFRLVCKGTSFERQLTDTLGFKDGPGCGGMCWNIKERKMKWRKVRGK